MGNQNSLLWSYGGISMYEKPNVITFVMGLSTSNKNEC